MLSKAIKVLFIILVTSIVVKAQTLRAFSIDKEKYIEELEGLFSESNAELADLIMSEFKLIWGVGTMDPKKQEKLIEKANKALDARILNLGVAPSFRYDVATKRLNDFQMKEIIIISNKMLKKRMKATPDFENYIYAVLSFMITNQPESSFDAWSLSCKNLIEETSRKFTDYIAKCNDLFLLESIYDSPNTKWNIKNFSYHFEYDSLPKVLFDKMTLTCYSKGDSAVIHNTKGIYLPTKTMFYGNSGEVYWDRANIGRDTSWAELSNYAINLKRSEYDADSITYYNTKYFSGALEGRLEEKVTASNDNTERVNYPKFYSYNKKVFLEDIFKDIDYEGGFAIKGNRFVGAGTEEDLATIYINRNDTVFLKGESKAFVIRDDRVQAAISNVTIYLVSDSIFHPSISFKYLQEKNELTLFRSEKGLSASPFFNSYHELDMYVEWMKWNLDEEIINLSAIVGSDVGKGFFESSNYYEEAKFLELQGIDNVHPLIKVRNFVNDKNFGDRTFYDTDFRDYVRLPIDQVQRMLIRMSNLGFLIYDITKGTVTAKQRCFDYILAKSGKTDYDQLMFYSQVKNHANAEMSLKNYDLTIYGVQRVVLSDTQRVYVYPRGQVVTVHKNRDFTCDGIIEAGKFQYFGKTFDFYYDDFTMNLALVDSLRIGARRVKYAKNGKKVLRKNDLEEYDWALVRNVMENMDGVLEIDYPFNKSGIKKDSFPDYPIFTTENKSYVYYDNSKIQGGVYDRDRFYFQIYPFTIDSLNTFDETKFGLRGTFVSNIFPDFEENITIMDDHSLGFLRKASSDGFAMYGDKGKFVNDIKLSFKGLQGDGTLNYLTSKTVSKEFTFFPDSVNALAETFDLKEVKKGATIEYPQAKGEQVNMHWEPRNDRMDVTSISAPIEMYSGEAKLHGTVMLTPNELQGKGKMEFVQAELTSNLFQYKNMEFNADTSDFRLKTKEGEENTEAGGGIAFKTNNVNSYINFEERIGEFVANDGASFVDFPVNQYICYMDKFKWFMDKEELELSSTDKAQVNNEEGASSDGLDLSGSEFISTAPAQDSLRFISPKANYDLKSYIISAHDVKYINVADAKIYPGDGEVVVEKKAKMQQLVSAKIVANNTTRYHELVNANVSIHARRDYDAEADYEYVDASGTKQILRFDEISVDTIYQTVGKARVEIDQKFSLSPAFAFKGGVDLFANKKNLLFSGSTMLNHDCSISKPWVYFEDYIDPKKVMIPIDSNATDENDVKIVNGFMMKKDSTHIYPALVSYRKFHSDYHVSPAEGYLMYDESTKSYKLSNKDKLAESSFPGNLVELKTETCEMYVEGDLFLDNKLGQVKIKTVGSGTHNSIEQTTEMNVMMGMNFFLDETMWKNMSSNMAGNPNLANVDLSTEHYRKSITQVLGKEQSDKMKADLDLYGAYKKFPKEFEDFGIVFSDLNLEWDQESRSYVSSGSLGIQNIGKTQINKYVKGYIQIKKSRSYDELDLYIEIDDKTWYYFNYKNGVMGTISSSESYNATITALKPDKREQKPLDKADGPYSFMLTTNRKMKTFTSKMENR